MNWGVATWWAVGIVGLVGWVIFAWPVWRMMHNSRFVSRVEPNVPRRPDGQNPTVSVLVPACNEEAAISRCLESLLSQTYPGMQVVAINDRSTDRTGTLIDELAAHDPRLVVRHVRALPAGWLGKNHANYIGAEATDSDWILFTDGDVIFEPDALVKSVAFAETESLDHLCLLPGLIPGGYLETAASCFFGVFFCAAFKTWHVRNPLRQDAFCGVGAFNLVRRRAYEYIGGHVPLRLEVGDDVKLGKLIKRAGLASDILSGWPGVRVRWQIGLRGVIRGLEKNGFCGADYRVGKAIRAVVLLLAMALMPLAGTILAPGWCKAAFATAMIMQMSLLAVASRRQGSSALVGLAFPLTGAAIAYALARSTALALWRGGIIWRGTLYPLDELRRGLV